MAEQRQVRFVDRSGTWDPKVEPWPTVLVTKEEIDAEIARLASLSPPANGRRRSLIVHPDSDDSGLGFTPGVRVALEVLLPGERTAPIQHNAAQIGFAIQGTGRADADGVALAFGTHDVWTVPSMAVHQVVNDGDEIQARLTYSTGALLDKLRVPYADTDPSLEGHAPATGNAEVLRDTLADEVFGLASEGATVRNYEALVNPEIVEQRALIWTWDEVKEILEPQARLGAAYKGRMSAMLTNTATGRTLGTTNTLTAFLSVLPPNVAHSPHRHTATAINYHIAGYGRSVIGGRKVEWGPGSLLLGAPGMAVHHHGSADNKVYAFTVQDNALHLAMDTELWQEDLRGRPVLIGTQRGFRTNRAELLAAGGA